MSDTQISSPVSPAPKLAQEANELCKKALNEAKAELHPLLRSAPAQRLEKRHEFIGAFRRALEKHIARKLASRQPGVQAVFRFDESHATNDPTWDGRIHLLVKVPRLSESVKSLGRRMDAYLVEALQQLGLSLFDSQPSMLDVQQVTVDELRHGLSYGAMFCAVHSVPVRVWPLQ